MYLFYKISLFTLFCFAILVPSFSQDLEQIDFRHPIKTSGAISTGFKLYNASGIGNRYDPFVFTTAGQLNINAYGIDLPISFLYSSQNTSFRQPFNRFGITPKYKWAKAYLGYTSMNFSQFTFSGNSFLGGGIELTPNKFRFAAMYGRLRKEVSNNFSSSFIIPTYKRMGYGIKAGYGDNNNFIDLILFRAYDDPEAILSSDSLSTPQDNLVIGVNAKYSVTQRLSIDFEWASSAINKNKHAEGTSLQHRNWIGSLGLFNPTVTTQANDAIRAGLNYKLDRFDFGILYSKIDPGYQTLSTYFFNNDREELSFNVGGKMFKNKISVRGGIGQQRNNLANTESTTLNRIAGNFALNYAIMPRLNFSFSYSNFSSTVEYLVDELSIDSLNYTQVSETYGANLIYSVRKGDKSHSMSLNANVQGQDISASDENPSINKSSLWNLNSRYSINFIPSKVRLVFGLNYNNNSLDQGNSERYGVRIESSKTLLGNKLQLMLAISGYNSYRDDVLNNFTTNTRLGGSYRMNKHHSLNAGVSHISRESKVTNNTNGSFNEFRGDINYRYTF